jgi:methionyl-tRNA formyltransferase
MKILCCLNADVVSNVALNLLLPTLTPHEVRVGLSTRVGAVVQGDEPQARRELRVAEQLFAMDALFPLVERAGLPDNARYLTFGEIERHRGIPVALFPDPNSGEGLETLRAFAPDVVVSVRYGSIFRSAAIAIPALGILNLHGGLLPAYRGVIATFRALAAGDTEIGCTLHYIADATIDTGPIVATARAPVDRSRSLFWHVLSLYPPGMALVADALARLERGDALATHVQAGGTYFTYPRPDEWDAFLRQGWRVADASDLRDLALRYLRGV